MRRKITTIACLAVAGATFAAAPAGAKTPTFGFKTAKFRIEVSGVQTTAWKEDHKAKFDCDYTAKGEATEVIRFASKPLVATATSYSATDPTFRVGKKTFRAEVRMPSKVTRRSNYQMFPGKVCSYGDGTGGQEKPQPDCGQRNLTIWAEVRFQYGRLLVDDGDDVFVPLPGYRHCIIGGTAYPNMLWRGGKNAVGKPLTGRQLFTGPKVRTITVGRREVNQDEDSWDETTIKYTVKLTRLTRVRVF
jgi:hypothetical protein